MSWYMLGITHIMRASETARVDDVARTVPPLLKAGSINPTFHPSWMMAGAMYALRGEYAFATKLLDKAVAIETSGTGFIFLGSYVQRAAIHIHVGECDAADVLLDRAINSYPNQDHVYADTMTAYAYFVRGILEEHRGRHHIAQSHFLASCTLAESRDHRLAIGAAWTKSRLGLARTAFRRGDKPESDAALDAALHMHKCRDRFVWGYIMGASNAETWYEIAATHAVRGEIDHCIAALRKAADFGWSDMNQLNHDPNFQTVAARDHLREIAMEAAGRVKLPPAVGTGGLPSSAPAPRADDV